VVVGRNYARFSGGGFYLLYGSMTLDYVTIVENEASEEDGGGITNMYAEEIFLRNVTITRNSADRGSGISHAFGEGLHATLINCIVFGNTNEEIYVDGGDNENPNIISISYSDIEGGEDGITVREGYGEV